MRRNKHERYRNKIVESNKRKRKDSGLCADDEITEQVDVDELFKDFMSENKKTKTLNQKP